MIGNNEIKTLAHSTYRFVAKSNRVLTAKFSDINPTDELDEVKKQPNQNLNQLRVPQNPMKPKL